MEQAVGTNRLKELAAPMANQMSKTAKGLERHKEIGRIIENQSDEVRITLTNILDDFLMEMNDNEASDIDIGGPGCGGKVWYRIHGDKSPSQKVDYELSLVETDFLLHNAIMPTQRQHLLDNKNLDFSYSIELGEESQRFRADMYFDLEHLALNMRKIENEIRPFRGLNLHPEIAKALSLKYYKYGLTLITGITGSGKSSTLDTIIDANNRSIDSHIVIIASPVELIHDPIRSVVRHREVGRDVASFKEGAVQALRQDPDIIVVGELRDPETIMTTLEITDSGHKTFGTLHTSSAMESIERILGEVPPDEQNRVRTRLADVLTCVISQKLVPSLDGKRVLAKEVLLVNSSVKAAIRNNNVNEIYQMLMEGGEKGMNTMEQDLKRLYDEGKISREEAINNANNKKRVMQLLTGNDL
ncbi:Flp pilus assembly complex ATPase component TadA [Aliifodinibius sp. S!AR15-10]|uniref:type IV pilus twitching motility protein PilT n=1 Tax=Aliifodinibius sp. S!AR15-10 TaxID=2950437 RepID=UPI0028634BE5|nr:ATPase, T2SS/T4P/T4SS family [Aliifodinibius sp. S!AR15-10]MDR8391612.1 Flp pilus assembly complex ATPase component TadA [Aliifodinibius sp. S!AR15-10]